MDARACKRQRMRCSQNAGRDAGRTQGDKHALTSHAAGGHGRERPVAGHAHLMTAHCVVLYLWGINGLPAAWRRR